MKTLTTFDLSSDISGAIHPNVPFIPYLVDLWVRLLGSTRQRPKSEISAMTSFDGVNLRRIF